ncbi:hypothetical protein C0995_002686 [Termitomyces sp. Mi166|nr:hypothetical protein C0995_002686 [Termitomyces sp. Mi166\
MDSIQNSTSSQPQPKQQPSNLYLSDRLVGLDKHLDSLSNLFEQLQLATTECCDAELDLLTFAQNASYFGVIMKKKSPVTEEERSRPYEPKQLSHSGTPRGEAIGLVYLVDLDSNHPLLWKELNIGIILEPSHRGKGYAPQAIEMVLEIAFKHLECHRVQAILPDHIAKDRAICLFTQMRFDHEGTRRRGFFSPMEQVYKDVTYMGMLDTDWILCQTVHKCAQKPGRPAPKSVWDELLQRHQREREELLNWEASIRYSGTSGPRAQTPIQSFFRTTADDEDGDERDTNPDAASYKEPKEEEVKLKTLPMEHERDPFATSSDSDVSERSTSPGGYLSTASSSGSAWDVVEPSDSDYDSSTSSSSFDSGDKEAFEFFRVCG